MRRDLFKEILDSRVNTMRKYLNDPTLTPKQRNELRKAIRRRHKIANDVKRNKQRNERINYSIYASQTPKQVRSVASRYRNSMSLGQRQNTINQMKLVRQKEEEAILRHFLRGHDTANYRRLLRNLRDMKTNATKTKRHIGSRA